MQRKTLLVVTSTFPRWEKDTTPSFVFDLTAQLTDTYDVIVLAPHTKGAKCRELMGRVDILRYRYFFEWGESLAYKSGIASNLKNNPINYLVVPFFLLAQTISLIALLRNRKIDIIHAHWSIPNGLCAAIALIITKATAKLVCTVHGSDLNLKNYFFVAVNKFVFKKSSAITTVSQSLFDLVAGMGVDRSRLSVISMGVDARKIFISNPKISNRKNLLFVGRLVKSKGLDILLKAMTLIIPHYPEQQLIIVGDGVERSNLEKLTYQLSISKNVTFVGAKSHCVLPEFYQEALIFISPSLAEGFGLTLIEAMACGCAVIASDLPAAQDIIEHEKTGLVFEVKNVELLAKSILSLLIDKALCDRLIENGQDKVLVNFDWSLIVTKYQNIFNQILKK